MVGTSMESAHAMEDKSLPICWGIFDGQIFRSTSDERLSSVDFFTVDFAFRVGFCL
jgi:hypothetical protein